MKKRLLLVIFIITVSNAFAQKNNAWQLFDSSKAITSEKIRTTAYSENQKLLQFNPVQFKQLLANVPERASGLAGVEIILPNVNGEMEKFLLWESSNFEPELQANFPEIRAYVGKGITDPSATLNLSFSPSGIQTMVFRADTGSEFIEPYTKDNSVYVVFDSQTRISGELPFNCSTTDVALTHDLRNNSNIANRANNQVYKTGRLALSCTGEYTVYHGGTVAGALAAMNATMSRCNGVFEKDLAVKLLIIANNNAVIYTSASTDPYSPSANMGNWNSELQATLTSVIGEANYDIGHLFGATGGGGNAGCIGCVCVDGQKGSGITSPANGIPQGDTFDIDYVAHEMGHQMGANHTFTHTAEDNSVNVEPGSGSTIMAYAGIGGGGTDMQSHSDDYFTYRSILQIQTYMATASCLTSTSIVATNPRPTVSAGSSYTIPIGTAFKLTGTGTGTAGEVLTYCWEQNNDATAVGGTTTFPSPTKTDGPNFRSRVPSLLPVRYMPPLANVLNGQLTTTWETVSTVARTLNFALTVRDNVLGGGQTNTAAMGVTVNAAAGPFTVTSQNATGLNWTIGGTENITWNVANTTALAGSANVNIKLSTDGGLNFDTVLAANTPNDGSEQITVPNLPSVNCRILIEPTANIYYAVNSRVFAIGAVCNSYSLAPNAAIADGSGTNTAGVTTSSVINVPASLTINNMKVNLKINHTKLADLIVKIQHPDGTLRTLWSKQCTTNSNLDVTFSDGTGTIVCGSPTTGTYQSFQTLAGFNTKNSAGNWTLTVTDYAAGNTGTLVSWGVDFGCTLANEQFEISDLKVYPNPNRGNFTIEYGNPISNDINVAVYDIRGRMIFENTYSNQATFNENIQLNNAQAGIYLVNITDGTRKIVKKIAIE